MKPAKPERRKRLFVSKSIQGRMLRRFCGYWVIYHIILVSALTMDVLLSRQIHSFAGLFATLWQEHHWTFLLLMAIFHIIFRDLLVTTHRIAGPLLRFERVLKQMAQGQRVEKVRLRKDDLLFEFQNTFIEFIEARDAELDTATRDIEHRQYEEMTL